jgi:hypothetical protein
LERALPQFPNAPPIPPPGEILEKWRQELNNAGISGSPDVQRLLAQGANVVQSLGGPSLQVMTDLLRKENGPLAAAGRELVSVAGEMSDAGQAIGRFAEAQITGMGTIITDAQRRFAEGKIVDGLWHITGDMGTRHRVQGLRMRNPRMNKSRGTKTSRRRQRSKDHAYLSYNAPLEAS